ncbi:MAG: sugar ABC transporter substrate-binding protein [Desulfobacterales bacterium]|nr:MAG: sugar ABC transporter substrate-binding protein [Desulfobacterales bacterium]
MSSMIRKIGFLGAMAMFLLMSFGVAWAASQSERAIELGKKYKGTTLTLLYEGIQAGAIKTYAPNWEKVTGMKIKVVETPFEELVQKAITEHQAGTGAFDIMLTGYQWVPDYVAAGMLEPIDKYIDKHMTKEDLEDITPGHRISMMYYDGKTWGMPADGDLFILYYRKDLFDDPQNKQAFLDQYGHELAPPKTWDEYNQIGQFFTDRYKGQIYGAAGQRGPGQAFFYFAQVYQGWGGQWFDPDSMKPLINGELGVKALEQLKKELAFGPPGMEKWGAVELWSAFLEGKVGMLYSFPPIGRFSEAAGGEDIYPTWLPMTKIKGKVDYALLPGPSAHLATPWIWGISSNSKHKDAAFAFEMWFTSPEVSIQVCTQPNSLIDPHRFSHYESEHYQNLWPNAKNYLAVLREANKYATMDIKVLGGTEYQDAVDRAVTAVMGGADIQKALDEAAQKMEDITNRFGRENVKKSYAAYLQLQEDLKRVTR